VSRSFGLAISHALVAALVVELLLLAWRVRDPRWRRRLRLLVVAAPILLLPIYERAAIRHAPAFEERWALLSSRHWAELRIGGVPTHLPFLGGLALLGLGLFLADALPFAARQLRRSRARPGSDAQEVPPSALVEAVQERAAAMGVAPPRLIFLPTSSPVLFCRGARAPELVVSAGLLALLDPAELRAALAHELAHVAAHDLSWSWLLLAARAAQAWNPVVQVVVRAAARDAERAADDRACEDRAARLALAEAILKTYRAGRAGAGSPAGRAKQTLWRERLRDRARSIAIEERCRRLLEPPAPGADPFPRVRLAAAAASIAALLFFVV
jgi:Zn-dependent protease with chaperone function